MLHDPRHDPWSLRSLRDWLSRKDPDESYNYASCDNCLLAQYFREKFGKRVTVGPYTVVLDGVRHELPEHFNRIAAGNTIALQPSTFGGALARVDAVLAREYA